MKNPALPVRTRFHKSLYTKLLISLLGSLFCVSRKLGKNCRAPLFRWVPVPVSIVSTTRAPLLMIVLLLLLNPVPGRSSARTTRARMIRLPALSFPLPHPDDSATPLTGILSNLMKYSAAAVAGQVGHLCPVLPDPLAAEVMRIQAPKRGGMRPMNSFLLVVVFQLLVEPFIGRLTFPSCSAFHPSFELPYAAHYDDSPNRTGARSLFRSRLPVSLSTQLPSLRLLILYLPGPAFFLNFVSFVVSLGASISAFLLPLRFISWFLPLLRQFVSAGPIGPTGNVMEIRPPTIHPKSLPSCSPESRLAVLSGLGVNHSPPLFYT